MFPSRVRRFCTQELKVFPIQAYLRRAQAACVNAVGIRAAESEARSKFSRWEWSDSFDCWVWRPLLAWTEADVIEIHQHHGLEPNPLYLQGATRVGCWPCIFARKQEIRLVAEYTPEKIDEIEALEAEITSAADARAATKGEVNQYPRTWFAGRGPRALGGRAGAMPIRKVEAWSKTAQGGRDFEPFEVSREGCVRWGLCEADPDLTDE